ncbi:hypothetical protein FRC17_001458, partial [Serendipita sp. 399]
LLSSVLSAPATPQPGKGKKKSKNKAKDTPEVQVAPQPPVNAGEPSVVGLPASTKPAPLSHKAQRKSGRKEANPIKLKAPLMSYISKSILGSGTGDIKKTVDPTKLKTTRDAIKKCSREVNELVKTDYEQTYARRAYTGEGEPLETHLTTIVTNHIFTAHAGLMKVAPNEPAFGADRIWILEFTEQDPTTGKEYTFVVYIQFKVLKYETEEKIEEIEFTHSSKTFGSQLENIAITTNTGREDYNSNHLVFTVIGVFDKNGLWGFPVDDVFEEYGKADPESKTMDATAETRRRVTGILRKKYQDEQEDGLLEWIVVYGLKRAKQELSSANEGASSSSGLTAEEKHSINEAASQKSAAKTQKGAQKKGPSKKTGGVQG